MKLSASLTKIFQYRGIVIISHLSSAKSISRVNITETMGVEMKVIVAAIIFTLLSVVSFASDSSSQIRGQYGNLVETKERHGDGATRGTIADGKGRCVDNVIIARA